jgi:phage gp29-like protein
MDRPSFFLRFFPGKRLADNADKVLPVPQLQAPGSGAPPAQEDPDIRRVKIQREQIGSSGIQSYFGYVQEDYLATLRGHGRADIYDKMRRSDPQIKMALKAVKDAIKSATWAIEPGDPDDADAVADADLIEHILFNDMDRPFANFLHEALSCIDFGHSVFEQVHKPVLNHPKFGSFIGVRQFGHRSPRTIHRFNIDNKTGELLSVTQYAYGDLQRVVDIPAEFLVVFSVDQEGDNYEGVSFLRACYGPYLRKNMYQKLMAIGIEKYAVPTPVATVPAGKENSQEYANLVNMLQIWTSHEQNFVTKPEGWEIEFQPNPFDAEKVQYAIDAEDKAIINAFVANFLDLGTNAGGHGSFALGADKSQFFLGGLEQIAKGVICENMNRGPIRQLVRINRGEREVYPKLTCSGITDKGGLELAQALKFLTEAQIVIPDDPLEENIRSRYSMPKKSDKGQRQVNSPGSPTGQEDEQDGIKPGAAKPKGNQLAERRLLLAQNNARAHIKEARDEIKEYMREGLGKIAKGITAQVMANKRKLSDARARDATKNITPKGVADYQRGLIDKLASVAVDAIDNARKEVPRAKNAKILSEGYLLGDFERLPRPVQKRLKRQAELVVKTQLADLEKAIYFQYDSSVESTESDALIEKDMEGAAEKTMDGAMIELGSANTAAIIVNSARQAFFFDDEVLPAIASFTFTNPDPVSPICQDLAGTTFATDDPENDRFFPPLHHNCKSYIVPNLVDGPRADRETESLKPSNPDLEKYITL